MLLASENDEYKADHKGCKQETPIYNYLDPLIYKQNTLSTTRTTYSKLEHQIYN